jgi:hypothetical protein
MNIEVLNFKNISQQCGNFKPRKRLHKHIFYTHPPLANFWRANFLLSSSTSVNLEIANYIDAKKQDESNMTKEKKTKSCNHLFP